MTAIEYIDMMNSTIVTPQATAPMCSAMDLRSNCMVRPPGLSFVVRGGGSGQLEVYRHRHDDRHRNAIQQGGRVDPLFYRFDRRLVQQGDAAEDGHVRDLA